MKMPATHYAGERPCLPPAAYYHLRMSCSRPAPKKASIFARLRDGVYHVIVTLSTL